MKILVGSNNPVKITATQAAFERYFTEVHVEGLAVEPGVPSQPIGTETFLGAENRATMLGSENERRNLGADYVVGIEGGVLSLHNAWFSFGAVCIMDRKGHNGLGTSPLFPLPNKIVREINKGKELGHIIDAVSDSCNSKQKNGAIGFLSRDQISRHDIYEQAVIMALLPFLNPQLY
jgi:inosine/xanthosine triphosphatase